MLISAIERFEHKTEHDDSDANCWQFR